MISAESSVNNNFPRVSEVVYAEKEEFMVKNRNVKVEKVNLVESRLGLLLIKRSCLSYINTPIYRFYLIDNIIDRLNQV